MEVEEDGNANANGIGNSNANANVITTNGSADDSLSEILKEESGRTRSDSLSEVLNETTNDHHDNVNPNNNNNTNKHQPQPQPVKKKMPPRLKMNAYPTRHWTEIRNFCEFYTVTKFNWSYLSLRPKEELSQHRHHRHGRHNNNHHNSHSRSNSSGSGSRSNSNSNLRSQSNSQNSRPSHQHNHAAISTISIAFSPDGRTVASTHGDHTVKITCCNTGALIRNLEGHPRTPWTVKYHPTKPNLVASGCLGFQVRVWDWNYGNNSSSSNSNSFNRSSSGNRIQRTNNHDRHHDHENEFNCVEDEYNYENGRGVCLSMIRLTSSIISLSFHPTGSLLAVASGHSLHLWVYDDTARRQQANQQQQQQRRGNSNTSSNSHADNDRNNSRRLTNNTNNTGGGNGDRERSASSGTSTIITQIRYEHNLRCVHFPPGGDTIILGGVNPPQGDTSYSLRLWDFDLEVALNPQLYLGQEGQENGAGSGNGAPLSLKRDALKNFRTFVPRALLYNDGGFDVSPDGKMLCGCAEYWLPDGVNSAMELIEKKEELAWMDEEKNETKNSAGENSGNANGSSNKKPTIVRSPRRKMNRQHRSKEDKRLKESSGSAALVNEGSDQRNGANSPLERPGARSAAPGCRTPPNPIRPQVLTSPPSPPGRRWSLTFGGTRPMPLGSGSQNAPQNQIPQQNNSDGPPPPPLPPNYRTGIHAINAIGPDGSGGRFVPHVVVVNLDKQMEKNGELGQVLEATPLGSRASSVTCVKFSPSAEFCLLGYGVREHATQPHGQQYHPVTALYRVRGGISHIATMLSSDDDVNIARFHPQSGQGFVYGTKQGRVRVLSPRPWDQYYE